MAEKASFSYLEKAYNPILLALAIFGAHLLVVLGAKLVHFMGIVEVGARFPWVSAASFLLFYAVFNSIFSLSAPNAAKYWSRSVFSFLGLAAANGFTAYLFSSLGIDEAGSYRWIYIVVTFGYLVFLSIVNFIKKIVEFAQKEEWNQPRARTRKKRN